MLQKHQEALEQLLIRFALSYDSWKEQWNSEFQYPTSRTKNKKTQKSFGYWDFKVLMFDIMYYLIKMVTELGI